MRPLASAEPARNCFLRLMSARFLRRIIVVSRSSMPTAAIISVASSTVMTFFFLISAMI